MSFNYTPKSEKELIEQTLLEPGEASFEVLEASGSTSKNGNPQIQLMLQVKDSKGKIKNIFDYLIATEQWDFKIRHFCYSCGLGDAYEDGKFGPGLCVGKKGK